MPILESQGFIEIGADRLEYRWIEAQRPGVPNIVLLHEGLGCVGMWRDFPERLAAATGSGVFTYSRAGYGGSSPCPLPRPVRYLHKEGLEVLPALLDQIGLGPVVLFGHSDGASISLIHAGSVRAGAVLGLVLLAPHVFNEDLCVESIRKTEAAFLTGDLRARLERWHGTNVDCAFNGWKDTWLAPGFRKWNIESYLPGVRVPTLVIQGADDEYGTAAQYHAIAKRAGGPVTTRVLTDCGHSPWREQTELVLQDTAAFITGLVAEPKAA